MSEHLPECPVEKRLRAGRTVGSQTCICAALRTCEERVLNAAREAIEALVTSEFWEGVEGRPAQWWIVKAEALAAIDALREKP